MSQPVAPEEVEARRRERAEEYGAFIAAQPIPWMGAPAFTTGDPVPKSTVERLGWVELGLVVKAGTKAAEALQPALTDPTEAMDAAARAFGGPEAAGPPPEPKKTAAARKKPPPTPATATTPPPAATTPEVADMPPAAVAVPLIMQDPGYLFWAPLASTLPTMAALASTYSADTWPAAWIPLGATEDGSELNYEVNIEPVRVAELFDPIKYSTTERSGSLGFNLASFHLNQIKRVMNGGTIATVSGTGPTLSSKYTLPAPGAEVRCMLGWESLDNTVRMIAYQTINGTTVSVSNKKAPALALLPCVFSFEVNSAGQPFEFWAAGVGRLGT